MYTIRQLDKSVVEKSFPTLQKIAEKCHYKAEDVKALHTVFAAYHNKDIVALGGVTCYHGFWCLRLGVVLPEHRGNGLQRKLIKKRIEFLKNKNAKHVNVWVSPKNSYSMNNIIAENFKFVNEKPRIINDIEYIKLRKTL